ncbi:MAG: O-antigen polymerase, partial [Patescibacteria group bacterium]
MPTLAPYVSKVSAVTTTKAEDLKRRRLVAAQGCLEQSIIDEDDDIEAASLSDQYSDLFDDEGRRELVVVGFDMDSVNGVINCLTAMKYGIIALGKADNTDGAMRYFIKQLTGSDPNPGQNIKLNSVDVLRKAGGLKNAITAELNKIDGPSDELRRNRLVPIVNRCFTASTTKPGGFDTNRGDFQVVDLGYFQQRDNIDWKKEFNWITQNDGIDVTGGGKPKIGDINLQFDEGGFFNAGVTGGWRQDNSNDSSDFFPIGPDISQTKGYLKDAIVDCHFVERNKALIFGGDVKITNGKAVFTSADGSTIDTSLTGSGTGDGISQPSCENKGGELSWILCPTLRLMSNFLGAVDEKLNELLSLPSAYYDNPSLEASWARIRNLAYVILVPIMLIMIISTALGFEFVSAYTFKKALPRLVMAVIFMSLSFEITKFLIVLTNDVGQGVLGIISSSFSGEKEITIASLFDPDAVTGGLFSVGLLAGGVLALGVIPILLSYAFVAGMVLFVALLALSLRQMLLITFMVLGPLAILAWIFPGNDKLWKLWWGGFSKLLILFPLIMILIAGGRVFAALVQDAGGNDFLATVLKLTAYVGPYFFIPALFKFAGGIFATITGMANDKSRGLFDRQKKFRQKQFGHALERAKQDNYFKGGTEGNLKGRFNRGLQTAALAPQAGLRPLQMKRKMDLARGMADYDESSELLEKNQLARAILNDDDKAQAVLHGNNDKNEIKKILQARAFERFGGPENTEALNMAVAEVQTLNREAGAGALQLAAIRSIGRSSTGWNNTYERDPVTGRVIKDAEGNNIIQSYDASGQMLNDINTVSGGNRGLANRILAEARESQVRAGRLDTGGGGFSDTSMQMDRLYRADKEKDDPTGFRWSKEQATTEVTKSIINGKSAIGALAEKSHNGNAIAPVLKQMTEDAVYSGNEDDAIRAIAQEATFLDAQGSTSKDNARIMGEKVFNQQIDITKLPKALRDKFMLTTTDPKTGGVSTRVRMSHAELIEGMRDDPAFRSYRREYGAAYGGPAAAAADVVAFLCRRVRA